MSKRRAGGDDVIVGNNIRVHRLARTMSQSGLADAIGITFQQVQKYEKGVNRVGSGRLVRIANALGVPVLTLLAGVPGVGRTTPVEPSAVALLAKARPLRLIKAYATIEDTAVRVALVTLTEGIARLTRAKR